MSIIKNKIRYLKRLLTMNSKNMIHLELKCRKIPYPVYSGGLDKSDILSIRKFFKRAIHELPDKPKYYIWLTGTSGSSIALMLQTLCPEETSKMEFIAVRKKNEDSHDWGWKHTMEEANERPNAYHIFLDDCIASGETLNRVISHRVPRCFDEVWILSDISERVKILLKKNEITKCISFK